MSINWRMDREGGVLFILKEELSHAVFRKIDRNETIIFMKLSKLRKLDTALFCLRNLNTYKYTCTHKHTQKKCQETRRQTSRDIKWDKWEKGGQKGIIELKLRYVKCIYQLPQMNPTTNINMCY